MKETNYLHNELMELVKNDSDFFDFIHESALDGIWYWDLEKPENEWMSPGFWTTLGYDPDEKEHKSSEWQDMIFKDDLEKALRNFRLHSRDADHPYDQIVRYKHKSGRTVWVRCRGVAIRDDEGNPIRMFGAHTDITKLMQSESMIIALEQKIDAIKMQLETSKVKISLKDSRIDQLERENQELLDKLDKLSK